MHVTAAHPDLGVIFCQVLCHTLGERSYKHALAFADAVANLVQQIVNLPLHRTNLYRRIHQPRRPDNLLHHNAGRFRQLVWPWRGGDIDKLVGAFLEFLEFERAIVQRGRQAETILDQVFLAGAVAMPHPMELRNRLM